MSSAVTTMTGGVARGGEESHVISCSFIITCMDPEHLARNKQRSKNNLSVGQW